MKRTWLAILFLLATAALCAAPYWYKSQFGTGNPGNCGPASVAMMAQWANGQISWSRANWPDRLRDVSVRDARSKIGMPYRDGATSIDDLERALAGYDVDFRDVDYKEIRWKQIDALLTLGYKLIVLVNLDDIDSPANLGQGLGGHYFVISGSRGAYFEIQDPYNGADVRFRKDVVTRAMTSTRFILIRQEFHWWERHGMTKPKYERPVGIVELK